MKKLVVLTLTLAALALSACNTIEGVGQDISGAANSVRGWFSH